LRGLAVNLASTHQTENPHGFSEVGENKQLLIAIVVKRYFSTSSFFKMLLNQIIEASPSLIIMSFSSLL
jgi:hypothetical protein